MLKLYNLKKLNIEQCENISFDENSHFLIKVLYLQNCLIIKPKSLLIFPNLEGEEGVQNGQVQVVDVEKDKVVSTINVIFWPVGG